MTENNLAEMPENYDMADDIKASTVMTEPEVQATVASNVNDNMEGDFPPLRKEAQLMSRMILICSKGSSLKNR